MKSLKGDLLVENGLCDYDIRCYKDAIDEVMTILMKVNPIDSKYYRTSHRIKKIDSVIEKLQRKKCSICDITDIAGIRFVFGDFRYVSNDFTLECLEKILRDSSLNNLTDIKEYVSVFSNEQESASNYLIFKFIQFIKKYFDVVEEIDYINNPKDSGYQSYHIVVRASNGYLVEIQARNLCQHIWSYLQHDVVYKNSDVTDDQDKFFRVFADEIIENGRSKQKILV